MKYHPSYETKSGANFRVCRESDSFPSYVPGAFSLSALFSASFQQLSSSVRRWKRKCLADLLTALGQTSPARAPSNGDKLGGGARPKINSLLKGSKDKPLGLYRRHRDSGYLLV